MDRSRAHYGWARRYARYGEDAKARAHLGRAIDYAATAAFGAVTIDCPALCGGDMGLFYAYSVDGKPPTVPTECRVCHGATKIDAALYDEWKKKDTDYDIYTDPDRSGLPFFYGRVSLEDYNKLKSQGYWSRFNESLGDHIKKTSYLLIEKTAPSIGTGATCPNPVCRAGEVPGKEKCRVCGGKGRISEEERAAWMQDTEYVASLKSYPDTYSGFCDRERRAYIKREVLQGRLPDTTLDAFIRDRRVRLGIPPIREALLDLSIGRGDLEMPCPAGCSGGKSSVYWDNDLVLECTMCLPYGGKGTIPARELANWMSDPGYRAHYNTMSARDRRSFYEWSGQKREQSEPKRAKLGSKDPDLATAYKTIGLRYEDYDLITDDNADALAERINKAYRLKSLIHHPDKGGSHEACLHLGAAFNTIRDSHDKLKSRLNLKFGS
jgi:hypothetical protein